MKKLLTILSFLLINNLFSQTNAWKHYILPVDLDKQGEFHQIDAVDDKVAWGIVYYGDFSGQSWTWDGSDYGGYIVKTSNGGTKWERTQQLPGIYTRSQTIQQISAVNERVAYVTTEDNNDEFTEWKTHVYKTTNGGKTWNEVTPSTIQEFSWLDVVYFWNENKGVVIGDDPGDGSFEIYTTEDGGKSWNRSSVSGDQDAQSRVLGYFDIKGTKNGHIYFTGWGDDENPNGFVYYSTDYGRTWRASKTTQSSGEFVAFRNQNVGVVSDNTYDSYPFTTHLSRTKDGGATWQDITPNDNNFGIYFMQYIPETNILVITTRSNNSEGPFKTLMSKDDGSTWQIIDENTPVAKFEFIDSRSGYGCLAMSKPDVPAHALVFNPKALNNNGWRKVELNTRGLTQDAIKAFPSVFSDNLTLEISASEANEAQIELIDAAGRLVKTQKLAVSTEGVNQTTLQTKDLARGMYLFKVQLNDKVLQQKVIKQ